MESDGERYDWMPDKLAGNFSEWKDYRDMETTGFVQKELRPLVDKLIARSCVGRQAIEIHAERTIGWASSIHIDKLDPETRRSLNLIELGKHKVRAYIVTNKEFLAPRTHLVQMNIQIKPNDEAPGWICLIHNVYPGPYLGEFEEGRHITNELGLVTLHWSQQGAGKD